MIVLKVLNIESCGAYKQMPNFSGGVSEVCTDISQASQEGEGDARKQRIIRK